MAATCARGARGRQCWIEGELVDGEVLKGLVRSTGMFRDMLPCSFRSLILLAFLVCGGSLFGAPRLEFESAGVEAAGMRCDLRTEGTLGLRYTLLRSENGKDWLSAGEHQLGGGGELGFTWRGDASAILFKLKVEVNESLTSKVTAIEYPIHVYVPEGYGESERRYPVIYATDGQWISNGFSAAIREKGKEVILVTIEQGPGDRRATDYRLPGAVDYFRVLKEELIPAVESVYRIDAEERSICGTSYGGLLVGLVLLMDDVEEPLFKNYLSFDGSFYEHRTATNALEQARYEASNRLEGTFYMTSATRYPNNNAVVTQFENKLEARGYQGLRIIRKSYAVVHNDVAQPSFDEALDTLF